ncbi:hypothetical protein ACFWWT_04165 [Streptomyces sp. NPDC058676]|uniref:hypothetical protein n=1 Tax=Streptomyces sp. NPDC058676 TaxID=3346593 RepID=UPI00364A6C4C
MRRTTTTTLIAAACLALAGCSSSGDGGDKPSPIMTKTVTASPSLSEAEARQACVDGWSAVIEEKKTEHAWEDRPAVCDGLPDQTDMYMDGLDKKPAENRRQIDECLENPACTSLPIG